MRIGVLAAAGKFFYYDVINVVLIWAFVGYHMRYIGYNTEDWRVRTLLYFAKVMMGLAAFPFLIFQVRQSELDTIEAHHIGPRRRLLHP